MKMKTAAAAWLLCLTVITHFQLTAQSYVQVGSGSEVTSGYPVLSNPVSWPFCRSAAIFSAADLSSAGLQAGNITGIGWNVLTGPSLTGHLRILMRHTTSTSHASPPDWTASTASAQLVLEETGTTLSYPGGWITRNFSSPFAWNGTSGIEVFVQFERTGSSGNGNIAYYGTTSPDGNVNAYAVNEFSFMTTLVVLDPKRTNTRFYSSSVSQNTAPTANDLPYAQCGNAPFSILLADAVSDPQQADNLLSLEVDAQSFDGSISQNGLEVQFNPAPGAFGTFPIPYTVCDNGNPNLCASAEILITLEPAIQPVIVNQSVTPVSCFGAEDGAISLAADAGGASLSFAWDSGHSGPSIGDLTAGEYEVVISAAGDCTADLAASFTVPGPEEPLVIEGLEGIPISGTPGGSSDYSVTGGTPPYSYSWTDEDGNEVSTDASLGDLTDAGHAGTYFLLVTDANGCTANASILVTGIPSGAGAPLHLQVHPNPSDGLLFLSWSLPSACSGQLEVLDLSGRTCLSLPVPVAARANGIPVAVDHLPSGSYVLRLSDGASQALRPVVLR